MTGEDILGVLEDSDGRAAETRTEDEATERFFVFSVGEHYYALPPGAVREIVSDLEVFPLPACPPYVSGLINCHGTPYAVLDLMLFFRNERHQAALFLVLNLEAEAAAFGCTAAVEIAQVPRSSITSFSAKDENSRYFTALFPFEGQRVPILDAREILRKLEADLA